MPSVADPTMLYGLVSCRGVELVRVIPDPRTSCPIMPLEELVHESVAVGVGFFAPVDRFATITGTLVSPVILSDGDTLLVRMRGKLVQDRSGHDVEHVLIGGTKVCVILFVNRCRCGDQNILETFSNICSTVPGGKNCARRARSAYCHQGELVGSLCCNVNGQQKQESAG